LTLLNGKMKRALFCCLRGGNCAVNLTNRKKCVFCRFEKCKLKGMVSDFKESDKNTGTLINNRQHALEKEEVIYEVDFRKESQHSHLEVIIQNENLSTLPRILHLQYGPEDVRRINFYVDLFRVQKVVMPIGLHNIISVLECFKNRKQFPQNMVKTHIEIHELWWSQFCVGLDEFQDLNPEEKTIVLKNVPLADRLCQALYLGPGAETNLIGIVKNMTSDKSELETVERYLEVSNISKTATAEYESWRSSPWESARHLALNRDIVTWGQKGLDKVSEILVCLILLFSQEDGEEFSTNIGQLHDRWRFILWRYLETGAMQEDTKIDLFNGALSMVDITKQIWTIEQNCAHKDGVSVSCRAMFAEWISSLNGSVL